VYKTQERRGYPESMEEKKWRKGGMEDGGMEDGP
jgi:hypothetical protein